jgi:hypothetical protein
MKVIIEGFVVADPKDSDSFPIITVQPTVTDYESGSLTIEDVIESICVDISAGQKLHDKTGQHRMWLKKICNYAKRKFFKDQKCGYYYFCVMAEVDNSPEIYTIVGYDGAEILRPQGL